MKNIFKLYRDEAADRLINKMLHEILRNYYGERYHEGREGRNDLSFYFVKETEIEDIKSLGIDYYEESKNYRLAGKDYKLNKLADQTIIAVACYQSEEDGNVYFGKYITVNNRKELTMYNLTVSPYVDTTCDDAVFELLQKTKNLTYKKCCPAELAVMIAHV